MTVHIALLVLKSWNALVIYFQSHKQEAEAVGYGNFLRSFEYMQLIVFVADVLLIYQRFNKKVQSDSLTIASLAKYVDTLRVKLNGLRGNNLVGGWAEQLDNTCVFERDKTLVKGIEMITQNYTRSSGKRNF